MIWMPEWNSRGVPPRMPRMRLTSRVTATDGDRGDDEREQRHDRRLVDHDDDEADQRQEIAADREDDRVDDGADAVGARVIDTDQFAEALVVQKPRPNFRMRSPKRFWFSATMRLPMRLWMTIWP